jgi:hypothetical protein
LSVILVKEIGDALDFFVFEFTSSFAVSDSERIVGDFEPSAAGSD